MRRNIGVVFLLLLAACAISCSRSRKESLRKRMTTEEFMLRFVDIEPWSTLSEQDIAEKGADFDKLGKAFARMAPVDARDVLEQIVSASSQSAMDRISNAYLLNRYYFAVPESVPIRDVELFGGWWGVPTNNEKLELLWPLKRGLRGVVQLKFSFQGFSGPPYDAVGEFDFFKSKYPPRDVNSNPDVVVDPSD
jgi:hypothetical protein